MFSFYIWSSPQTYHIHEFQQNPAPTELQRNSECKHKLLWRLKRCFIAWHVRASTSRISKRKIVLVHCKIHWVQTWPRTRQYSKPNFQPPFYFSCNIVTTEKFTPKVSQPCIYICCVCAYSQIQMYQIIMLETKIKVPQFKSSPSIYVSNPTLALLIPSILFSRRQHKQTNDYHLDIPRLVLDLTFRTRLCQIKSNREPERAKQSPAS